MSAHYTYLARCADDTLYAGYCLNVKEREAVHNAGKGAKYTRARRPVTIVYFERFKSKSKAMKREAAIKKWTKFQKEVLLRSKRKEKNIKTNAMP